MQDWGALSMGGVGRIDANLPMNPGMVGPGGPAGMGLLLMLRKLLASMPQMDPGTGQMPEGTDAMMAEMLSMTPPQAPPSGMIPPVNYPNRIRGNTVDPRTISPQAMDMGGDMAGMGAGMSPEMGRDMAGMGQDMMDSGMSGQGGMGQMGQPMGQDMSMMDTPEWRLKRLLGMPY